MAASHVLGSTIPVTTSYRRDVADRESMTVDVEGVYSDLEQANPSAYCPAGFVVNSSSLASTGDGLGKLTLRCVAYDSNAGSGFSAVRTTFRVDMCEVQYDLEDHPAMSKEVRAACLKWLATDEEKRVQIAESTIKFFSMTAEGTLEEITSESVKKYCNAYLAGIKTFNRYFPVIEKISVWKNPPGLLQSGRSFTRGSPTFSANVGKFDSPPLTLNGYPAANWFKSKDSWSQNADTTWSRTEQWTYTPDGRNGDHAWIYSENASLTE